MKNICLLFLAIFLSCGERNGENEHTIKPETGISEDLQLSGSFIIVHIGNEEVSSEEISLNFDEKRKELRGNAGCNRFSSNFVREGNKISFGEPTGTRMFCEGKMDREEQVMKILPQIREVRESEDAVVFISENGEQLLTAQKSNDE